MNKRLFWSFLTSLSLLLGNSNLLLAEAADTVAKTDQDLAKEVAALRRQNAELRDRLRRLEPNGAGAADKGSRNVPVQPQDSANSAMAADLPTKAPPPQAIPVYNWTGFYIGGNVGGGWGHRNVDYVPDPFTLDVFTRLPIAHPPDPASFRTSGVVGGLQVGWNWQFHRNWLIGQESDFNWSNMKGSGSSAAVTQFGQSVIPFTAVADEHIEWFGTFRARFGYLPTDNLLAYVTGGFAYGKVERHGTFTKSNPGNLIVSGGGFSLNCVDNITPCYSGSSDHVAVGWTLGGGFEYAVWQRWTLKAEYLYVSLDGTSFTETAVPVPSTLPASLFAHFSNRATFNVARVGVNYHF